MIKNEFDLLRAAEEYRNVQQQKQVKNSFSCKGFSPSTMEEVATVLEQREAAAKQRSAKQRHIDINRVGVDKSNTPVVSVAMNESVLRGEFPHDPPTNRITKQDATAAVSVDALSVLHGDCTQLLRTLLLRARFEQRAEAARKRLSVESTENAKGESVKSGYVSQFGGICSLSMINVASSPTTSGTSTNPSLAFCRGRLNFTLDGGAVMEEAAPLKMATDLTHLFSDVQRCELIGTRSQAKKMKEPLQFKLNSYRFFPGADQSQLSGAYTFQVPANPLLQAAVSITEGYSYKSLKPSSSANAHVPPIEHFVQPLATLETFPSLPHNPSFLPRAPHVEATSLCPQIQVSAPERSVSVKECSISLSLTQLVVSSQAKLSMSNLSHESQPCATSCPVTVDTHRFKIVPLHSWEAERKGLTKCDSADSLSDSDDEGDMLEGIADSNCVGMLLRRPLPRLEKASSTTLHQTRWVPQQQLQ